jgi:hypothetical protein
MVSDVKTQGHLDFEKKTDLSQFTYVDLEIDCRRSDCRIQKRSLILTKLHTGSLYIHIDKNLSTQKTKQAELPEHFLAFNKVSNTYNIDRNDLQEIKTLQSYPTPIKNDYIPIDKPSMFFSFHHNALMKASQRNQILLWNSTGRKVNQHRHTYSPSILYTDSIIPNTSAQEKVETTSTDSLESPSLQTNQILFTNIEAGYHMQESNAIKDEETNVAFSSHNPLFDHVEPRISSYDHQEDDQVPFGRTDQMFFHYLLEYLFQLQQQDEHQGDPCESETLTAYLTSMETYSVPECEAMQESIQNLLNDTNIHNYSF